LPERSHQRSSSYRKIRLLTPECVLTLPGMFLVNEADAAAIRAAFDELGELSAAIELRRRYPGITDNAKARELVRTIAGWRSLPPSGARSPTAGCQIIPLRPRGRGTRSTKA
jgi:hypothetical protein